MIVERSPTNAKARVVKLSRLSFSGSTWECLPGGSASSTRGRARVKWVPGSAWEPVKNQLDCEIKEDAVFSLDRSTLKSS